MKIQKFNSILEGNSEADKKYPFRCKFKDRNPDPGLCYIISMNFDTKNIECSNGSHRYFTDFDSVEFIPDLFILNKYNL